MIKTIFFDIGGVLIDIHPEKTYQYISECVDLSPDIIEKKFPSFKTIVGQEKIGYKIKYNLNEMMFFSPNEENKLRKLYRFDEYVDKKLEKPLILCNKEVFIRD